MKSTAASDIELMLSKHSFEPKLRFKRQEWPQEAVSSLLFLVL